MAERYRPPRRTPTDEELRERVLARRQASVRRSLREQDEAARERAARTHRLVVLGATVESILGQDVDGTTLAGACRVYRDAMQDPVLADGLRRAGLASLIARVDDARPRHCELRFPTRPSPGVRRALLSSGWRYDPDRRAWRGSTPSPDLELQIREQGGVVVPRPEGDQP